MIVTEDDMNFWERKNGYGTDNVETEQNGKGYGGKNNTDGGRNFDKNAYGVNHCGQGDGVNGNRNCGYGGQNRSCNGANGAYCSDNGQNFSGSANIEDEIRRFSGMSNDELTAELIARASASRASGTFDVMELEKFYSVATMFMNTDQLTRLRALLNMLEK